MTETNIERGIFPFQARVRYSAMARHNWDILVAAIGRAKEICLEQNEDIDCHFRHLNGQAGIEDWYLSKYACYLINRATDQNITNTKAI